MGDSSPQNGANECLPEPLRFQIKSDGTIDRGRRSEPLFIDLRPGQGFEEGFTTATDFRNALEKEGSFSRSEINQLVAEYANRLDKAKHKLAAALLQVSSDELEQRAYRHQLALARRRQRLLAAVVLCLCLLLAAAVGSSIYAFHLEVRAERAGMEAEQSRALSMRLQLEAQTEFARAKQAAAEAETAKQQKWKGCKPNLKCYAKLVDLTIEPYGSQDRKRMARLILGDVTLNRDETLITAQVRFMGGATKVLRLPMPARAWQLRNTKAKIVAEIDRLLEQCTESEIVDQLNNKG